MKHTLQLLVPLLLLLTACQSGSPLREGNLLFRELPGGQFVLHRDIVIAPRLTHIVLQEGTAAHGASEFKPRCELQVRRIMDTPQTIPAGSFRIGKVRGLERFVNNPPERIRLAAAGGNAIRLAGDDSNEWIMHTYWMQLLSEDRQHPNVPVLVCGGAYNFPFYARYPTLGEIQDALGEYATLSLR